MKKFLKIMGWVTLSVVAMSIVVIAIVCSKCYYHMNEYELYEEVSINVELREKRVDYTKSLYNTSTGKYTIRNIEWISEHSDSSDYAVFCREGKRGFFNIYTGEMHIKDSYERAWLFSEGVAAVVKDGKLGFINEKNETVIPFQYDMRAFEHFVCVFCNGYCLMIDSTGKFGFIDKTGNWVVEPQYSHVCTYNDDYYVVKRDGKYGLLDRSLNTVFPVEYDGITVGSENGFFITKDGWMKCVDCDGNEVYPFVYDYSRYLYYCSEENEDAYDETVLSKEYILFGVNGKEGVMRRDNGKIVIPAIYDGIEMISEKLFEVQTENFVILIDTNGNILNGK